MNRSTKTVLIVSIIACAVALFMYIRNQQCAQVPAQDQAIESKPLQLFAQVGKPVNILVKNFAMPYRVEIGSFDKEYLKFINREHIPNPGPSVPGGQFGSKELFKFEPLKSGKTQLEIVRMQGDKVEETIRYDVDIE